MDELGLFAQWHEPRHREQLEIEVVGQLTEFPGKCILTGAMTYFSLPDDQFF